MDENSKKAGELLAGVIGDDMWSIQVSLTCSEADNLATAAVLLGQPQAARNLLEGHADHDSEDEEDEHYVGEGETAEQVAAEHVRAIASHYGIRLDDELNVPDDLRNEPPANSVRTAARNITEGQRVKVWGYRDDDPWPHGKSGFHEGQVEVIEFQPGVTHGVPAVHIKFVDDDRWLHAVAEAVCYIVNES